MSIILYNMQFSIVWQNGGGRFRVAGYCTECTTLESLIMELALVITKTQYLLFWEISRILEDKQV